MFWDDKKLSCKHAIKTSIKKKKKKKFGKFVCNFLLFVNISFYTGFCAIFVTFAIHGGVNCT